MGEIAELAVPKRCFVSGSSGFVGHRLVEMLLERDDVEHVVGFDIRQPTDAMRARDEEIVKRHLQNNKNKTVKYVVGDISKRDSVLDAFKNENIDTVFHTAALVGPYYNYDAYLGVNYYGCVHIVDACKEYKIGRLVLCSTPGTRYTGNDIKGLSEDDLPEPEKGQFTQIYAETKAMGQRVVLDACSDTLLTVSVAPHQVYGEGDTLFIPAMLETANSGALRIIGDGENIVSCCYVDNICHALILAATKLVPNSPILKQFYIVTDGEDQVFWRMIDDLLMHCGYPSLYEKYKAPGWFLEPVAHVIKFVGWMTGQHFRLDPFAVRMLIIHRYFSIEKVKRELGYKPLVPFNEAWQKTKEYFKNNSPYSLNKQSS